MMVKVIKEHVGRFGRIEPGEYDLEAPGNEHIARAFEEIPEIFNVKKVVEKATRKVETATKGARETR